MHINVKDGGTDGVRNCAPVRTGTVDRTNRERKGVKAVNKEYGRIDGERSVGSKTKYGSVHVYCKTNRAVDGRTTRVNTGAVPD